MIKKLCAAKTNKYLYKHLNMQRYKKLFIVMEGEGREKNIKRCTFRLIFTFR